MTFPDVPLYERTYTVERFMTDRSGCLSYRFMLYFLDDIMARNAEHYGVGFDYHLARGEAWVLTDYDLVFHGRPAADEPLVVGTCPYSFRKAFGYRLYRFRRGEDVFMEGMAKFTLFDLREKTIKRPDQEVLDKFHDVNRTEALVLARYRPKKTMVLHQETATVRHSHIDVNGHMNNAHYLALAHERMREDDVDYDAIQRVQVHYRKEALEGDIITLSYYAEPGGLYVELSVNDRLSAHIMFHTKP